MLSVRGDDRWKGVSNMQRAEEWCCSWTNVRSCKRISRAMQTCPWQLLLTIWQGPPSHSSSWLNREPVAVRCPKANTFIDNGGLYSTIGRAMFTLCIRPWALSVASELRDQQPAKINFLASHGKPTTRDSDENHTLLCGYLLQ